MQRFLLLASALLLPFTVQAAFPAKTLRSFGAVGNGRTDDRAAIQKALQTAKGPIDGEGKTYAVCGTINVSADVDFRNATLVQTLPSVDVSKYFPSVKDPAAQPQLDPPGTLTKYIKGLPYLIADADAIYPKDPVLSGKEAEVVDEMIHLRTLFFHGDKELISVRLQNIKVMRGQDPSMGSRTDSAGIYIAKAKPLVMDSVEVTGNGKGRGIGIDGSSDIKLTRLYIHDIEWAFYKGDVELSLQSLKDDFGWNNNPIYEYRDKTRRFVRYRVQEQLSGLSIGRSENIEISDSRIERLVTKVENVELPWQVDGMTIGDCKNLTIRNCHISKVWEGIDLTGRGVENFLEENITIEDTFSYGFKTAHPQKNGKIINCISRRAGNVGFTISEEGENLTYINCQAFETGSTGYWRNPSGFRLGASSDHLPKNVTLQNCSAINREFKTMAYGFLCDPGGDDPQLGNKLINPTVEGATVAPIQGFTVSK